MFFAFSAYALYDFWSVFGNNGGTYARRGWPGHVCGVVTLRHIKPAPAPCSYQWGFAKKDNGKDKDKKSSSKGSAPAYHVCLRCSMMLVDSQPSAVRRPSSKTRRTTRTTRIANKDAEVLDATCVCRCGSHVVFVLRRIHEVDDRRGADLHYERKKFNARHEAVLDDIAPKPLTAFEKRMYVWLSWAKRSIRIGFLRKRSGRRCPASHWHNMAGIQST
jgi:hypothetical protein